jgi:2-polyprenyl-6-methoxyphenol hydroxylase-like FAD-dependent oxidoreductase
MYTQMKRNPLDRLTKGKVVLIGDACHPMLLSKARPLPRHLASFQTVHAKLLPFPVLKVSPPAHAQGVSSSVEDAAALEILLADLPPSESTSSPPSEVLLKRLQIFQSLRLPRVSATQILTDPVPPGPGAGPAQDKKVEEIHKYYQGPLPPKDAFPHSEPICQFFFAYDVRAEAEKALKEAEVAA